MQAGHELWAQFQPNVFGVTRRDGKFWRGTDYVFGEDTKIHKISYITEGEGELEYNASTVPLTAGMLVYSSPTNWIQLTSSRRNPLCFFSVMFDYALIVWEKRQVTCLQQELTEQKLPLDNVIHVRQQGLIADMMRQIYLYWHQKTIGYEWKVKLLFLNLLAEIQRQQSASRGEDASLDLVNQAIAYINLHYRETMDRKQLAAHVSLSPSHFSLLFRKYAGCTPMQYLIKIRMDKAKELLRESKHNVTAIGMEVGYGDPLYFSRVFARETGMSPREYRNYYQ